MTDELPDDMVVCRDVTAFTIAALASDPEARAGVERMVRSRERRMHPRPGAAAREIERTFRCADDPAGTIRVRLPAMRDGGSMLLSHHDEDRASLHSGHILKLPHVDLPETIRTAAEGRLVGEIVDLEGSPLEPIAGARITALFETDHMGRWLLIHTDMKRGPLTCGMLRGERT